MYIAIYSKMSKLIKKCPKLYYLKKKMIGITLFVQHLKKCILPINISVHNIDNCLRKSHTKRIP